MNGNFRKEVIVRSLDDIKVELDEEFDRNFERKSYFDEKKWPERKFDDGTGSLMQRSGRLRKGISSKRRGTTLAYEANKPYARIHNESGEIKVTRRMKGYFFYKLKEAQEGYTYTAKGEKRNNKRNRKLSEKEQFYKSMALKKVGSTIKIPERRFIGRGKHVDKIIREITKENIEAFFKKHNLLEL